MSPTHTEVTDVVPIESCGKTGHTDCGLRGVLDRMGDKWSVLVIVELSNGVRRFRQLQHAIDGISQRMLTLTLRRLERNGIIERTVYPTVPAQVDYRLTTIGASFTHMLASLATWSQEHQADITKSQVAYDAEHPGHDVR